MLERLIDHFTASIGPRLRALLFGAATSVLAVFLAALFAALSIGFAALAAYTALSAAEGPAVAALIVCGVTAGLALAIFALWAWRARSASRNAGRVAPPTAVPADPLVQALLATGGAQEQLARALAQAAPDLSPMRLVALALVCGIAVGGRLGKRPVPKA